MSKLKIDWDDPNTENSFEPPFDVPALSNKQSAIIAAGILVITLLVIIWRLQQ
jgi:hypothetical protein